jgi:hypothetical protein
VGTNPANQDYALNTLLDHYHNTLLTDRTAGTSIVTNNGLFSLEKISDRLILYAFHSCSFDSFSTLRTDRAAGTSRVTNNGLFSLEKAFDQSFSCSFNAFSTPRTDRTARTGRVTNNGLFSLEKTSDRLILHALQQSWSCSFDDDKIGSYCARLGESVIFAYLTSLPKHAFCRVC